MIRVRQIKVKVDSSTDILLKSIAKKLMVSVDKIKDYKIVKRSLDARYKPE